MKNNLEFFSAKSFMLVLFLFTGFLSYSSQRVWSTNPTTANTPATAFDWSDAANWKNGLAPQAYDGATFEIPSSMFYVRMPAETIVTNINIKTRDNKYACLFGGKIILTASHPKRGTASFGSGYLFCDLETGPASATDGFSFPFIAAVDLAGRAIANNKNWVPSSGWISHRLDKFAYSSNPLRTDDIVVADNLAYNPGNANVGIYCPQGDDGSFGKKWNLVKDSPFITRPSSQDVHTIAAGTIVSGEGIPEGTFVKRVFNNGYIELSQNATLSLDSASLDFAPFKPEVRLRVNRFSRMGDGTTSLSLYKYRPEDILVFDVMEFSGYSPQVQKIGLTPNSTYYPGTLSLHKVSVAGGTIIFQNTHINIAGNNGEPTEFSQGANVQIAESCTSRISVEEGATGVIKTFTNVVGTLVKDGKGILKACFAETDSHNAAIVVEDGTLLLTKASYTSEGALKIGSLTIKEGGVLEIPPEGMSVETLSAEVGAKIKGPGNLEVRNLDAEALKNVSFENASTHTINVGEAGSFVTKLPEGEVVGHPVFWVDASRPESIEITTTGEGDESVTKFKWKDCREGEPMFCTNIYYAPLYVNGDTMAEKYVNIRCRPTSTNALTEGLVWSVPVGDIKAVFLVQDPRDGGGEILGRTSRLADSYYGTQGGPYYRGDSSNWQKHLISPSYATPCVKFGRFYIDGQEICGYEKGYLRTGLQVIEHHVNDNEYANLNNKKKGLWIDAFGIGYKDKDVNGMRKNGCMRIAEYIIYTNHLTHVERLKVSQYLARKWLGKDISWTIAETNRLESVEEVKNSDITINVPKDLSYAIMSLGGDGEFCKTGEGNLFIGNITNANVRVSGGTLTVRSLAVTNSLVPQDSWIHVDATESSTMDMSVVDGVTYVSKWRSLGESTLSYIPWAILNEDGAYVRGPHSPTMLRQNAINSLPAIDLGPLFSPSDRTQTKRAMRIIKEDGTFYNKFNSSPRVDSPMLKTVFVVADTSQGGNALLGADMDGYPEVGFAHQYTPDNSAPIISCYGHNWGHTTFSNLLNNGTAMFRTNGVPIHASKVPYSGNSDVFTYHSFKQGPVSDTLGIYGYEEAVNGMMFGEVLLYKEALPSNTFYAIEAYLRMKWRNERTPGYEIARMSSLFLENGAQVSMCGWGLSPSDPYGYLLTKSLGGNGFISGDVRLETNAALVVDVLEDGTPGCVEIDGSADFSKGGNVAFTGSVESLKLGLNEIVKADTLMFGGEWTCNVPLKNRTASLYYSNNTLYLNVNRSATILILR